jgi:hypothetical protein
LTDYDPADNAAKSYDVAIEALRERLNSFRREIINDCTLYLGDCRLLMPLLPKVDVVVTDPPYGIKQDRGMGVGGFGFGGRRSKAGVRVYDGGWDDERPEQDIFHLLLAAGGRHIIWGGN